ncbi:MAG: hypothetical protein IPP51_00060 [Bacteroidetes bacterium]|nr:hypothetical protein [Bacteroidota bacterium]
MLDAGLTDIDAVVCPPGVQLYVPPAIEGEAVKVAFAPAQIVEVLAETVG